jgi:hypothetical protein
MAKNLLILSCTAISLLIALPSLAQQRLLPTIQLSADEAAKTKQVAQNLKDAEVRNTKAKAALLSFYETYQAAHTDLQSLQFSSDFRLAIGRVNMVLSVAMIRTVELSADERQQFEALNREVLDSAQSKAQAEKSWKECQDQLLADHVAITGEGGTVALPNGKKLTIPPVWLNGLAFAPDFRIAVPRDY